MTVLARKQGAALVIRDDHSLGIFTDKGFTPVDFKVALAMKLATGLNYTPVLPAQEMEEAELLRFLEDSNRA